MFEVEYLHKNGTATEAEALTRLDRLTRGKHAGEAVARKDVFELENGTFVPVVFLENAEKYWRGYFYANSVGVHIEDE